MIHHLICESTLDVGDRVLVRNLHLRSKHKLADRWEPTVYVVTKRMGDLPVYTLKPEKKMVPWPVSKPQRPQTRQRITQAEANNWALQDDDDGLLSVWTITRNKRHFIKIYDTPILKPRQTQGGMWETWKRTWQPLTCNCNTLTWHVHWSPTFT